MKPQEKLFCLQTKEKSSPPKILNLDTLITKSEFLQIDYLHIDYGHCVPEITDFSAPKKLRGYEWAKATSIDYLNIINYECRRPVPDIIPWIEESLTEKEVIEFCPKAICHLYLSRTVEQIAYADKDCTITKLVEKLIHVYKVCSITSDVNEVVNLWTCIIYHLFAKQFYDRALYFKMWNMLCTNSNEVKRTVLHKLIEAHHFNRSCVLLNYILNIACVACFDYWNVCFRAFKDSYYCPVTLALVQANTNQMITFLRFGFKQMSHRISTYDAFHLNFSSEIYSSLRTLVVERQSERSAVVAEVMLFLLQIYAFLKSGCCLRQKRSLKKCFRLMWENSPVPFVTRLEIEDELERRFGDPLDTCSSIKDAEAVLSLPGIYDVVCHEETPEHVQPRTLQELCRCSIRDTLRTSWRLPDGIKDLPIPQILRSYMDIQI